MSTRKDALVTVDQAALMLANAEKLLREPVIKNNFGPLLVVICRLARTVIALAKTELAPIIDDVRKQQP